MKTQTAADIRAHAEREYPRECCGLIAIVKGKERYFPCTNKATTPSEHFAISGQDYATVEDQGEIIAVVHSHPNTAPRPSPMDLVLCEASGLEWHIVQVWHGEASEIYSFTPSGYEAPLVGREFAHGVLDCYTLIRDYYARELKIELPNFEREDGWWNKGQNLYMEHFEECGFTPVEDEIQVGDVFYMTIRSEVANHAGVYIGNGQMLHHYYGRLSTREIYGGYWRENTHLIIRKTKP